MIVYHPIIVEKIRKQTKLLVEDRIIKILASNYLMIYDHPYLFLLHHYYNNLMFYEHPLQKESRLMIVELRRS
jgi:hypothetical protein